MKTNDDSLLHACLALLGLPVFIALAAIWDGYALMILWRWFVAKQFSLPELSLPLAIGVGLVAGNLTHQLPPDVVEKDRSTAERFGIVAVKLFFRPLFILVIGAIVRRFI